MTFFSYTTPSLKVCGVTRGGDAEALVAHGVEAVGINFWERSKRYCAPEVAKGFCPDLKGEIVRVGVYVNADLGLVEECFAQELIDFAQFHGDENEAYVKEAKARGIPFLRALALQEGEEIDLTACHTEKVLLDAHAPGVYGGTGKTIDWERAGQWVEARKEQYSVILAGGITPENAEEAVRAVRPCALDVASGAESAPGKKDFEKVRRMQEAIRKGEEK